MRPTLSRLSEQANAFHLFNKVYSFDEVNLPGYFKESFKDSLVIGSRGFGYWSWKPIVITEIFNRMVEGDCLLYIDAGCHLNLKGKERLIEYFSMVQNSESGILAFQANPPDISNSTLAYDGRRLFDQPNYSWIKGDLFDYFDARNDQKFTHSQAIGAGIILFKKCKSSMKILEEWRSVTLNHFNLIDDTPSVSPNLNGFIEHRHDQALWTLLCLKYEIKTLSAYEYWYPQKNAYKKLKPDWKSLANYPIHARRDKDMGAVQTAILYSNRVIKKMIKIMGGISK